MPTPALVLCSLLATNPWVPHRCPAGMTLETRDVPGSPFEEIRVTTSTPSPVDQVCAAVWGGDASRLEPGFRKRVTLLETATERWSYEQVIAPLVCDRDYTLHVQRAAGEQGGCEVCFETQNDKGPPPQRGLVRIPAIRGSWVVSPASGGGARVVYTVYSEPGGGIPAFLSRGGQRDSALQWMTRILSRLVTHAR